MGEAQTGAELLYEVISQRDERGSIFMTSNCHSMNGQTSSAQNTSLAPFWTA